MTAAKRLLQFFDKRTATEAEMFGAVSGFTMALEITMKAPEYAQALLQELAQDARLPRLDGGDLANFMADNPLAAELQASDVR